MGRLFEDEYSSLSRLRQEPQRPCVFLLGGTKVDDAFGMMAAALRDGAADSVLTCGLVGQVLLIAAGVNLGGLSCEPIRTKDLWRWVDASQGILERFGDKVMLPVDVAVVQGGERCEVTAADLPTDDLILDLGHATVAAYSERIATAGTTFANGRAGVFERPETEYGTKSLWVAMADSAAYTVLGGGDSIAAMGSYGLAARFSYVCTAGGAMVRFISGEELPVVNALRESALRFA